MPESEWMQGEISVDFFVSFEVADDFMTAYIERFGAGLNAAGIEPRIRQRGTAHTMA
jgi:hypothetical protein